MNKKYSKNIIGFSVCLLMATPTYAASYVQGTLDNGLRYHILTTDAERDYLDIHMQLDVGGSDELPHEYGSAHMLEHTLFHQSKHFPEGISASLIKEGWKPGEQFNAYTGYEQTKFVMTPPKGRAQLSQAMAVLSDILAYPTLSKEDWNKEQEVVLAEWRSAQTPRLLMAEQRRQLFYRGAKHTQSTLYGTEKDIRERKEDVLQQFHNRWYQPQNAQIAIIGDVKPSDVIKSLNEYFAPIKGKPVPLREADNYEPKLTPTDWQVENIIDPASTIDQVGLVFRSRNKHQHDYFSDEGARQRLIERSARTMIMERLDNVNMALPKGTNSILTQRTNIGHNSVAVSLMANISQGNEASALQQLMLFKQQLLQYPITEQELNYYREAMDEYIRANIDNTELPDNISLLTKVALAALRGRPVQPVSQTVDVYERVMKTITAKEVNERLHDWLTASDKFAYVQGRSADHGLTAQTVINIEEQLAKNGIPAPLTGDALAQASFKFTPASGTIVNETVDPKFKQVQHWQLSNGDNVVWLDHPVANGEIFFRSHAKTGYMAKNIDSWKSRIAGQFVWMSGPQGFDLQSLSTWRRKNNILLHHRLLPNSFEIRGEVAKNRFEDLLKLYSAYQLTPQVDEAFMKKQVGALQATLDNDNTNTLLNSIIDELRYEKGHLVLPTKQGLAKLTPSELEQQWQLLLNEPTTYYIVADLPKDEMQKLVRQYLAGIPRNNDSKVTFKSEQLREGQAKKQVDLSHSNRTDIDAWAWVDSSWSMEKQLQLIIAQRIAKTHLRDKLRTQEKGVYDIDFKSNVSRDSHQLVSHLHFNAEPHRANELWTLSQNILQTLPQSITKKDVDLEVVYWKRQEQRRLKKAATWLDRMAVSDQFFGDARYLEQMGSLEKKVTLKSVKQAAALLWNVENERSLWVSPQEKG